MSQLKQISRCICLLLDAFQQYLEMSVIFALYICTTSAKNCGFGNGNVLLDFFGDGSVVVGNYNNKVGFQVIAEKMKTSSYFQVRKCPIQ